MTIVKTHHHRHHGDLSDRFRRRQLGARRRRQIVSNVLFGMGCVLSAVIVITVIWLYTNE